MKTINALYLVLILCARRSHEAAVENNVAIEKIFIQFGKNLGNLVSSRIRSHLRSVGVEVMELKDTLSLNETGSILHSKSTGRILVFAIGNSSLSKELVSTEYLESLPYESFSIRSRRLSENTILLATNGRPLDLETHTNVSFNKDRVHYGAVLGGYASLELLGFAFLHPLDPYIPPFISLDDNCTMIIQPGEIKASSTRKGASPPPTTTSATVTTAAILLACGIDITESPYWPERMFHIHTQHPLEVTDVLQGHDIPQVGPHGPQCADYSDDVPRKARERRHAHLPEAGGGSSGNKRGKNGGSSTSSSSTSGTKATPPFAYCERWEDMVDDVNSMFEWAVANRQNKIEWLLLGNYKWGDELETRMRRLRVLTNLGHEYSLMVGADAPIGNIQQHAWHMVNTRLPFKDQVKQIKERVDWIFNAGFDFLTTESGLSEFTHPECDLMLDLMNEFANYVNGTWGREAGIKVHCSTGQVCEDFPDPVTGDPLNFNFLPMYATPAMGVFPHTVQVYALDDPTAGAYGNKNFSYIEDYLVYEAKARNRSVIFYGETAYWVNVDIDVPLFLPLYGQRRLHDLRRIAGREINEGFRMQGQMNFDSGWEWGYWLSDVVTARAAWNPLLSKHRISQSQSQSQLQGIKNSNAEEGAGTANTDTDRDITDTDIDAADTVVDDHRSHAGTSSSSSSSTKSSTNDNDRSYKYSEKDDQWDAFRIALEPIVRVFGPEYSARLRDLLVNLSIAQEDVLMYGRVEGKESPNLKKLSGFPYMSGADTWIELPRLFGMHLLQPDKVHFRETSDPDWPNVLPLLREVEARFAPIADAMTELVQDATGIYRNLGDASMDGDDAPASGNSNEECRVIDGDFVGASQCRAAASSSASATSGDSANKGSSSSSSSSSFTGTGGEGAASGRWGSWRNWFAGAGSSSSSGASSGGVGEASTNKNKRKNKIAKKKKKRNSNKPSSISSSAGEEAGGGSAAATDTNASGSSKIKSLKLNDAAIDMLLELDDCTRLLSLRATQVRILYESRDPIAAPTRTAKATLQKESRDLLKIAMSVVARRESKYRVPWQRIASWRDGPTVYRYGYLWAVHSLYYWWRDQGLAEEGSLQAELSPCYLNRMDTSEVAVGWGRYTFEFLRTAINRYSPFTTGYPLELVNCFAPPPKEYVFPKDLYPFD